MPQNSFPPAQLFDIGLSEIRQPPPLPSHPMQQNPPPHPMQQMPAQSAQQTTLHASQQPVPVHQRGQRAAVARQQQPAGPRQAVQAPQEPPRPGPRQPVQNAQPPAPTHRPSHKNVQRGVKKEEPQMSANARPTPAQQAPPQRSVANVHAPRQQRPQSAAVARSASAPVNGNRVAPASYPQQPNVSVGVSVSAAGSTARGTTQLPTQLPMASAVANSALGPQQPYRKHPRSMPLSAADATPRKRRHTEAPAQQAKGASGNSLPCQYCGEMFDMKRTRDIHVRSFHERSFPCEKCSALFKTKSDANRHMRIVHDRVRPFACSECQATFAERGKLRRHKQTVHEKLRPYTCQICHAQFGERGNLNQHQTSRHAGMRHNILHCVTYIVCGASRCTRRSKPRVRAIGARTAATGWGAIRGTEKAFIQDTRWWKGHKSTTVLPRASFCNLCYCRTSAALRATPISLPASSKDCLFFAVPSPSSRARVRVRGGVFARALFSFRRYFRSELTRGAALSSAAGTRCGADWFGWARRRTGHSAPRYFRTRYGGENARRAAGARAAGARAAAHAES
eukprot:IDg16274t1